MTYEALSADPVATTRRVLAHLGVASGGPIAVPLEKQSDAVSHAWVERYRNH